MSKSTKNSNTEEVLATTKEAVSGESEQPKEKAKPAGAPKVSAPAPKKASTPPDNTEDKNKETPKEDKKNEGPSDPAEDKNKETPKDDKKNEDPSGKTDKNPAEKKEDKKESDVKNKLDLKNPVYVAYIKQINNME